MKTVTTKNILVTVGFYALLAVLIGATGGAGLVLALFVAFLWFSHKTLLPAIGKMIGAIFITIGKFFAFLIFGMSRQRGARYMDWFESSWMLREGQKGWLIDGKNKHLSEKASYQSIMTVAGVGVGKTSKFVFPNIFTLKHCSLVITDTSGELYAQSSGYLKQQGYDIICLNLMDMSRSHGYNPLHNANSFSEIAKIAHLIIRSSNATGNDRDQFWSAGAETIVRILIQCLKNKGPADRCSLGRIKQLLNMFDHFSAGAESQFNRFVMEATLNDVATWESYRGFVTGPEKTVLSFISTANTALMALGNPELANLTETHQIDFTRLQEKKTALFILARQQDMSSLSFILNAFYTDLFATLQKELNEAHLSVYALLDEFGQLYIPKFSVVAATARKYKIAFWLFLQSQSQLELKYGHHEAQTIMDSLGTEIYLAGIGLETAERLSRRMGRKRPQSFLPKIMYQDGNLMNPDEIISMRSSEALMFHGNKRPLKYRVKPYFKHSRFSRLSKIPPAELPYLNNISLGRPQP